MIDVMESDNMTNGNKDSNVKNAQAPADSIALDLANVPMATDNRFGHLWFIFLKINSVLI